MEWQNILGEWLEIQQITYILWDKEVFFMVEEETIIFFYSRVRMIIMGKGILKLAMDIFAIYIIPLVHGTWADVWGLGSVLIDMGVVVDISVVIDVKIANFKVIIVSKVEDIR